LFFFIIILLVPYYNYSKQYYQTYKTKFDVFEYAKLNTPKEAIFLIPPNYYNFRLIAQRAVAIDIYGLIYYELYAKEFFDRLMAITNNKLNGYYEFDSYKEIEEGYLSLNQSQIIFISKKYNVSFVLSKNMNLNLSKLYENEDFVIYDVRNIIE